MFYLYAIIILSCILLAGISGTLTPLGFVAMVIAGFFVGYMIGHRDNGGLYDEETDTE